MTNHQFYYLKKFAQAERAVKRAVETTMSHRSLSEFGAALGKQDHILYGRGSFAKRADGNGVGVQYVIPLSQQNINQTVGTLRKGLQLDEVRSGGKRKYSARAHEIAGSLVNTLLLGLAGAGIGAGVGSLSGNSLYGALGGLTVGTSASALANGIGALAGVTTGGDKKAREEYLKGDNMWKNYLIPGYGGYQSGSRHADVLDTYQKTL